MTRVHNNNNTKTARLTLSILAVCLVGSSALAAPWDFETRVDLGAIYTDNLTLAESGLEEDEIVYTITPTFVASTDGDRLTADLRYRPEAYFYNDQSDFDEVFHVADLRATGTIVRNALFLDSTFTSFQSIASPDANIPSSNIPITANRIDARVFEVRPYWEQDLGFADVLMEYAYTDTQYDPITDEVDIFAQDSTGQRGRFTLNNRSRQQGLAWGLDYQIRRMEYEIAIPWDYQRAGTDLGYWFNGTMRVFVSGGVETAFSSTDDGSLDDDFWEAGFQYVPNQRLDLELAIGERSYGDSYRASLSYDLRRGQTDLIYIEQPTTLGEVLLDYSPIIDTSNLDDFLNRPGSAERFVRKRGEWITTLELAKSDISIGFFYEERIQRRAADGTELEDEEQLGIALQWAWNLGSRSALGLLADFSSRDTQTTDADLTRFAIDYTYRISQRFSLVALAQRTKESSDNLSSREYTENQFRLILRTDF